VKTLLLLSSPQRIFFGSLSRGLGATATPSRTPIPAIDTSPELLKHTAVWLLGDEQDIPGLKDLAARKYANALPHGWNSEEFCKSLERIYEESPDSNPKLRNIAINFAGSKASQLIGREALQISGKKMVILDWRCSGLFSLLLVLLPLSLSSSVLGMPKTWCVFPSSQRREA
jgi:hypothetical protein